MSPLFSALGYIDEGMRAEWREARAALRPTTQGEAGPAALLRIMTALNDEFVRTEGLSGASASQVQAWLENRGRPTAVDVGTRIVRHLPGNLGRSQWSREQMTDAFWFGLAIAVLGGAAAAGVYVGRAAARKRGDERGEHGGAGRAGGYDVDAAATRPDRRATTAEPATVVPRGRGGADDQVRDNPVPAPPTPAPTEAKGVALGAGVLAVVVKASSIPSAAIRPADLQQMLREAQWWHVLLPGDWSDLAKTLEADTGPASSSGSPSRLVLVVLGLKDAPPQQGFAIKAEVLRWLSDASVTSSDRREISRFDAFAKGWRK